MKSTKQEIRPVNQDKRWHCANPNYKLVGILREKAVAVLSELESVAGELWFKICSILYVKIPAYAVIK
ncbi:hypothetical protein GCM10007354_34560 [Acinetobacter courvalinii]|uniref:Uncharacterized protein n=1 Tax=Acinetobacter courvalinii TaxID=280147 RepID=A0ABD0ACP3_9GAMM|nr:hypothetical protein GCM10007354_34560 [Acinetobacter courvalinii]